MMTAGIIKEDLPVIRRENAVIPYPMDFVIMEVWIFNSKILKSLSLRKLLFNFFYDSLSLPTSRSNANLSLVDFACQKATKATKATF